jgi:sec-independent protein translocase protein TatB
MFDIGWTEMLVIAIVMIVVVGPKDLPKMLRTFGKMSAKMRSMAGDFQKQFNEALKEAELDELKKSVDTLRNANPVSEIKKQLNPFEKAAADVRAGLQSAMTQKPAVSAAAAPAASAVHEAEPLKNGATAMPGVAGPSAMPSPPPALATEAPSPEPAKHADKAVPMGDPQPAGLNGGTSWPAPPVGKQAAARKPAGRSASAAKDEASSEAKPRPAKKSAKAKPKAEGNE